MEPPTLGRATSQPLAVLVTVVATLVVVGVAWVAVGDVGGQLSKPPTAAVSVAPVNTDDGDTHNDAVALVHKQGDPLDGVTIRVRVGGEMVFSRALSGEGSGGVVTDVDGDGQADVYTPHGDAACAVNEWTGPVTSGDRLVIRERAHARSADVIERGDTVVVVCVTNDGAKMVLAEETI